MAKVTTIPATISRFTATPINEKKKRRTAAYARVSTDSEEQLTSYSAQVDYYTNYIKSRDDWEFVSVYTDEGITGTNTKHREGFKRMVADALAGKIDLIVTKSVSRFARNTVDSLTTVRQLKEKGVEIYFEKENIWTLDSKGELLITIMSSLAQEESRSISENCTWGQRKRFADGKVTVPFKRFLGYDRGPDGNLVLNKDEAVIIRRIYSMFLQGMTPHGIAARLTADGIKSPGGKDKWNAGAVRSILTNEKYKGDALLQKSYTVDFLTKKKKVNEGEIPQYYVEGNHEAIIQPEVFELVQRELARRKGSTGKPSGVHIYSNKIKCGQCDSWYGSKVWHSKTKYRKCVWRCNRKFDNERHCTTPHFTEAEIQAMFIVVVNQLISQKESIIAALEVSLETAFDTTALEVELTEVQGEIMVVSDRIQSCIYENAHVALDQEEYQKRYGALSDRFDKAKARFEEIEDAIGSKQSRRAAIETFLNNLRDANIVDNFEVSLWCGLLDFVTVYSRDNVVFTFRNGTEIRYSG
ncbi:recombinase family protein [Intestinimonas butyriciproducens]|uniref:recombinase family protein n=2 Tax=Bacillota TaxID=1239 RepID=UPI00195A78CB|nr:recombinase family protein [Intestinimonas butyriciproducens]